MARRRRKLSKAEFDRWLLQQADPEFAAVVDHGAEVLRRIIASLNPDRERLPPGLAALAEALQREAEDLEP